MSEHVTTCRLCGGPGPLRLSHVIPDFVARWLRENSATGFMRSFPAPNRRSQGFRRVPLLCHACEVRFSASEKLFCQRLFLPFHAGRSAFRYDTWLYLFAASLSWRCLAVASAKEAARFPQHSEALATARRDLAELLLGGSTRVRYRHNLFFTPLGVTSDDTLPLRINTYNLCTTDMTPVYGEDIAATYVKLPGMFFWTSLVPPDPGGWRGTRISNHGTIRSRDQVMSDPAVGRFLADRVNTVEAAISKGISPRQRKLIFATAEKDPSRALQSVSYRAFLADRAVGATSDDPDPTDK